MVTIKQEKAKPEQSFQPPEVRFSHSEELHGPSSATNKKRHGADMNKTQKLATHMKLYISTDILDKTVGKKHKSFALLMH